MIKIDIVKNIEYKICILSIISRTINYINENSIIYF